MAIGDDRFAQATNDLHTLLKISGVTVTINRYDDSKITERNIFGTPQNYTPDALTPTVLVTDQYLDDKQVEAGSKPKEHIIFLADAGTFIEHDEVAYNNHSYDIQHVDNAPLGGKDRLEIAEGIREVEVL